MDYYNKIENVNKYIEMADGFDGSELINILKKYLKLGSSVLELGMGPGKDLDLLSKSFSVTGSDKSKIFLDLYNIRNPDADLLYLDAVTLDTKRKFDCIYSNKVLHHLTRDEFYNSILKQKYSLNIGGLLLHSLWYGRKVEEYDGMISTNYTKKNINDVLKDHFTIIEINRYKEFEDNDSLYFIARKK